MGDSRLDILHRLPSADRRLDKRVDVLHAKTGAVDTELLQAGHQRFRHVSRIKLDGVFKIGFEKEPVAQDLDDGCKPIRAQDARCSTAPVQTGDANRPRHDIADESDLGLKGIPVSSYHVAAQRLLGVATAIEADFATIRHMQID